MLERNTYFSYIKRIAHNKELFCHLITRYRINGSVIASIQYQSITVNYKISTDLAATTDVTTMETTLDTTQLLSDDVMTTTLDTTTTEFQIDTKNGNSPESIFA